MTGIPAGNKNNKNKNYLTRIMEKQGPALGRYKNVFLSEEGLEMLKSDVSGWEGYIEKLSSYMVASGKDYHDHAAAIIHWAVRDGALRTKKDYSFEEGESL